MRRASRVLRARKSEIKRLIPLITGLASMGPALAHGAGDPQVGFQTGPLALNGHQLSHSGSTWLPNSLPQGNGSSTGTNTKITSIFHPGLGIAGHALAPGSSGHWLSSSVSIGKTDGSTSNVSNAATLPNGGYNFDLSSSSQNIVLGSSTLKDKSSVTITVGDSNQTFRAGQQVTAAEFIAINEVVAGGKQTLVLSNDGAATGGSFVLNQTLSKGVDNLTIPQAVTALDYISGKNSGLGISGDLLNFGSIYGVGKNNSAGTISAEDIVNETGGVISTSLQAGLAGSTGAAKANVDLTLSANNSISNSGTISSSGALTLATTSGSIINNGALAGASTPTISASKDINLIAGSGNLSNAGLISSSNSNINVSTPVLATDISINGTGGVFSAQHGDINVRDSSYSGANSINMLGGNYLSNNLNLYSGAGDIECTVGQVSGALNTYAAVEHFNAASNTLVLGNNTINGDPTFANIGGGIEISGANTFQQDVAILAFGDIFNSGGGSITAQQGSSALGVPGANVTMVAGATIVLSSGPPPGDNAPLVTLSGNTTPGGAISGAQTASVNFNIINSNGGSIVFGNSPGVTVIDTHSTALFGGSGGSVTLAACANGANGGYVLMDPGSTINMSGSGGGAGGSLTIFAGGNPITPTITVNLGTVNSSGGNGFLSPNGGAAGLVNINCNEPTASGGGSIVKFNTIGDIVSGGPIITTSATLTNAIVNVANIQAIGGAGAGGSSSIAAGQGGFGGEVVISAGSQIIVGNISAYGGGGGGAASGNTGGDGGTGGSVTLIVSQGSISAPGLINTSGGGGGGGGSGGGLFGHGGSAGAAQFFGMTTAVTIGQIYAGSGGSGGMGTATEAGGGGGSLGGGGGGGADSTFVNGGGGGGGFFGGGGGGQSIGGGGGGTTGGAAGDAGAGAGASFMGGFGPNGSAGGFVGNGGEGGLPVALGVPNNSGAILMNTPFGSPVTSAIQNASINIEASGPNTLQIIINPNPLPTQVPFSVFGGTINLIAGGGITNYGGILASKTLTINTPQLVNTSTLIGSTVQIQAANNLDLNIVNNGSIIANGGAPNTPGSLTISGNSQSGNIFIGSAAVGPIGLLQSTGFGTAPGIFINIQPAIPADSNQVIFNGSQNLSGPTTITASGVNESVVVQSGAAVICDSKLTIVSPLLNLPGLLVAQPLFFDAPITPSTPAGGGTIVNLSGDVNLPSDLFTNGRSLSILASGNINGTGCNVIDTEGGAGQSGNVFMVAGFNILPTSGQPLSFNSQTTYTIGTASSGGSINLAGVVIATEGLGPGVNSGNIGAIANGGSVNLGTLLTSPNFPGDKAGTVFIIGEAGANVTGITTSATSGTAGTVQIFAEKPVITTSVIVQNGNLLQGAFGVTTSALVGNIIVGSVDSGGAALTFNATGGVNVADTSNSTIVLSNCAAGTTFQLAATGTAPISGGSTGTTIQAGTLVLSTASGSIGSFTAVGEISTTASSVNATTNAAGLIDITGTNPGAVTLNTLQSGGNALFDSSASTLTVNGASGAVLIIETTAASNGNIILSGNVTGITGVLVTAGGAGNITQTGGVVSATGVNGLVGLGSTNGNIGANGAAIVTKAPIISAFTGGDVYLKNIAPFGLTTLEQSQGNIFQLTSTGGLTLASVGTDPALAANNITLTAQGVNGTIALSVSSGSLSQVITGAAGVSSNASSVVLNAQDSIVDTVNTGSTIETNSLVLNAANVIGSSIFSPVNTNATSLTINGTNNSYVTDQASTTVTLNSSSVASGQTLLVTATQSGLTVAGPVTGGTIDLFAGGNGNLVINGNITTGTALLSVNTMAAAVIVNNAISVVGTGQVSLDTCNLNLVGTGTIIGNPLVMNCVGGGAGTIANSQGDVNLTSSFVFNGESFSIIASGNINASSPIKIDLSNANAAINNGSGGNLSIIAGFSFSPPTGGQVGPNNTLYTMTNTPSVGGGSVNLGSVTIDTDSSGTAGNGGNVLVVAHGGTINSGQISLGLINASSASAAGSGGTVTVIGQGGLSLGPITTTGATSGNVTISAATPQIVGGTVFIGGGSLSGSGSFQPSGGTFGGNISLDGIGAFGANVTVATGNTGSITENSLQSIFGGFVSLTAGSGGMGSLFHAISTNATKLTATSSGLGEAFVDDTGAGVQITGNNSGYAFDLFMVNGGNISFNGAGSVPSVHILTLDGNGGTVTLPASTLTANTDASGNGGSITVSAGTITWAGQATQPLTLNASGTGTGNGGSVAVVTTTGSPKTIGTAAGDFALVANSGASGGNGGTAAFITNDDLIVNNNGASSGLNVAQLASGNGGNITLSANTITNGGSGALTFNVNGLGSGNGGAISLTMATAATQTIGTAAGDFELSANSGASGGNAGSISLATGGNLLVNNVSVLSGLSLAVLGTNGNGGSLTLNASTISNPGGTTLALGVNGVGTGNGGMLDLIQTFNENVILSSSGNFQLTASSGAKGGNGGTIQVSSGGNLTVTPSGKSAGVSFAPLGKNGNGGNISLTAGTAGAGNLVVNTALSANGNGSGNGGMIELISQSPTAFNPGSTKTSNINGVLGAISASGKIAGSVYISNLGTGGITDATALAKVGKLTLDSALSGNIALSAALGGAATTNLTINATGTGNITETGAAVLTAGSVSLDAAGGSIQNSVSSGTVAVSASTLSANAAGAINVTEKSTKAATLLASAAGGAFTLTASGPLVIGGALTAGTTMTVKTGTGALTSLAPADLITGSSLTLSSTAGAFGTAASPLQIDTSTLTATTSALVNLNNNSASALTVDGATKTAKGFSLANGGDIDLNGTIGAKANTSVSLISGGNINTAATTDFVNGGTNLFLSATGTVGQTTTLNVNATGLTLASGGAATINDTSKTLTTVNNCTVGSLILSTNAATNVKNITSSSGSIALTNSTGLLQTEANAVITANNGGITFLNNNTKTGTIVFGTNSQLNTAGLAGGNITASIGPAAQSNPQTGLPNITITTITTGQAFFGTNGITAVAPTNSITLQGANVIFDTGTLKATAIKLDGNVSFTADPPAGALAAAPTAAAAVSPGPVTTSNPFSGTINAASESGLATPSSAAGASAAGLAPPGSNAFASGLSATSAGQVSASAIRPEVSPGWLSQLPPSLLPGGLSTASAMSATAGDDRAKAAWGSWATETELSNGEIPAFLSSDIDLGVNNDVSMLLDMQHEKTEDPSQKSKQMKLSRGTVVFAPSQNTRLETAHGSIKIDAGALVLVICHNSRLAIFNLDDRHKDSVKIKNGDSSLSLSPGMAAVLTSDSSRDFADVNPAQLMAYRGIGNRQFGMGVTAHTAEFSVPTAIAAVMPLKQMIGSKQNNAKRIADHLLKTAAIILQIRGNGVFKQILRTQPAPMIANLETPVSRN